MTLDQELRALLHTRADGVAPLPDPMAGVERRARGLRRRRTAAAVAGSAVAVLAVVGAVPLLTPDQGGRPSGLATDPSPSTSASVEPSPAASPSPYALDPADPWPYRGPLPRTEADTAAAAWRALHPGTSSVVPLFGQTYEPSGQPEVVVVGRGPEGDSWGVLTASGSSWTVERQYPLEPGTVALVAPLAGDESARLLVVSFRGSTHMTYTAETRPPTVERPVVASDATPVPLAEEYPGVAIGAYPGDRPADAVSGVLPDGRWTVAVPDPGRDTSPDPSVAVDATTPANVVDWPTRGTAGPALLERARTAYAQTRPGKYAVQVEQHVLAAGTFDGQQFLLGQFWVAGDAKADTFGVVLDGDQLREPQLLRPLDAPHVVALHLPATTTSGLGALVLVPEPGSSLAYSSSPDGGFTVVSTGQPGADGIAVVQRPDAAERAGNDRVRLLDGDGRTTATLPVFQLLCGKTSCG